MPAGDERQQWRVDAPGEVRGRRERTTTKPAHRRPSRRGGVYADGTTARLERGDIALQPRQHLVRRISSERRRLRRLTTASGAQLEVMSPVRSGHVNTDRPVERGLNGIGDSPTGRYGAGSMAGRAARVGELLRGLMLEAPAVARCVQRHDEHAVRTRVPHDAVAADLEERPEVPSTRPDDELANALRGRSTACVLRFEPLVIMIAGRG